MKIVFVIIGGLNFGYGHLKRTEIILSQIPKSIKTKVFCNKELNIKDVHISNVSYFELNEISKIKTKIKKLKCDILWFDVPDNHYKKIEHFSNLGAKIVSVNMFEKKFDNRYEDISVYPNFKESKKILIKNNLNRKSVQISGREFIVINPKSFYLNEIKKNNVMVSMGASDPFRLTEILIKSLCLLKPYKFKFQVILPIGRSKKNYNVDYLKQHSIFLHKFDSIDFALNLKKSKLAIINGGNTRYECVASKTFFLALSIHKDQYQLTELVTKHGFGKNIGVFSKLKIKKLSNIIQGFLVPTKINNLRYSIKYKRLKKNNFILKSAGNNIIKQTIKYLRKNNESLY